MLLEKETYLSLVAMDKHRMILYVKKLLHDIIHIFVGDSFALALISLQDKSHDLDAIGHDKVLDRLGVRGFDECTICFC